MNKNYFFTVFLLFLSGCMFLKPDYVNMITPEELRQAMQSNDVLLIDVHTPEQQHIKGTDLFIPYNKIEDYAKQLPEDKNTPIYLYCESGPMANAAARTLHDMGYNNLYNLEGGANAWRAKGYELQ